MSKTLKEAIRLADDICKRNAYSPETKTAWLEQLDGRIQRELWHMSPYDVVQYDWERCQDHQLLADAPYDMIYVHWLAANICLADGEYSRYQNHYAVFDEAWKEYARRVVRERGEVIA